MAIPANVPGVLKIDLFKDDQSNSWTESFYVSNTTGLPWLTADVNVVLTAVLSAYTASFKAQFPATVTLDKVEATDLSSPSGVRVSNSPATVGTAATTTMAPISCSVRTTFLEALRYRGGRPGIFQGGFQASNLFNPSHWSAATVTAAQSALGALLGDIAACTLSTGGHPFMCVVHRFAGHVELVHPIVNAILGVETQNRVCSQRRRLGRGTAGE